MPLVLAKDCLESKQHIATTFTYPDEMQKKTARQVLAATLKRLMQANPHLNTGTKIEAACQKRVRQRTVSNMTRVDQPETNAPTLDNLQEVAAAFGLEVWQLLLNEETVGDKLYALLLSYGKSNISLAFERDVGKLPTKVPAFVTPAQKRRKAN